MKRRFRIVARRVLAVVLVVLLVKAATTAFAIVEFQSAAAALRPLLTSRPFDVSTVQTASQRLNAAADRVIAEARLFYPLMGLAGADGCTAARWLDAADALSPVRADVASLSAGLVQSAASVSGDALDVHLLLDTFPPPSYAESLAVLDALPPIEPCRGASPRMIAYGEALESALFLLDSAFRIDWDAAMSDGARWLVVFNNTDERRATGGFTTAYLDATVTDGVLRWRFTNSYDVESADQTDFLPEPPLPMRRIMNLPVWVFRDANWSPDHPTAARAALDLFALNQPPPRPTGFITVNMTALDTLAEWLPPLLVDGATFDADTALDTLRVRWEDDVWDAETSDPERKSFIQEYAAGLVQSAAQLDTLDLLRASGAVRDMLNRRDIMLYSEAPELRALFAARGWDGAMRAAQGDYLMVVDTNMGYNKVSPRVERRIAYSVNLDTRLARVDARYTNTNTESVPCSVVDIVHTRPEIRPTYEDRMTACYWNYVRVFAPQGSSVRASRAQDIPAGWMPIAQQAYRGRIDAFTEAGYSGWGMLLVVPTGDTREGHIAYQLPETVITSNGDRHTYTLYVQRQPAAEPTPLDISITLPEGASLVSAQPAPDETQGQTLMFALALDADHALTITYEQP